MPSPQVKDVRFEHYRLGNTLGVHEQRPRLSWRFDNVPANFRQTDYEVELKTELSTGTNRVSSFKAASQESSLLPWSDTEPLESRGKYTVRVRATGEADGGKVSADWSDPETLEAGLLSPSDWTCSLISAPWGEDCKKGTQPEDLFRKEFTAHGEIESARLYITAQGVYEAEINGTRVGDHFLAPGWTAYAKRIQYQTHDVTGLLSSNNCIGIRVVEGWSIGRMGFEGGRRNLWADRSAVWAQLEVRYKNGETETVSTDGSWLVTQGPIRRSEIYDGEEYDARLEVDGWSRFGTDTQTWTPVDELAPLTETVELTAGFAEPVRRVDVLAPKELITTPTGRTILDFGQNLVGYVRVKAVAGTAGQSFTLRHAEVLENGELGTRPLRICKAQDTYILKGSSTTESYEPLFTFHGFRYVQIDDWPSPDIDLLTAVEAVVCNTDMERAGDFSCSDDMLNKLFSNVHWSMRGNFLSVPTDCPQRDERLGWTGDLALFAPTATFIYKCFGTLKNWLLDVAIDQQALGGTPAMVTPNVLLGDKIWGKVWPLAIWHDVTILAPWALWEATADKEVFQQQYKSMATWISKIPRDDERGTRLWDPTVFQLGDWLDPNAPPDKPQQAATDAGLAANAFLVRSLGLIARIAEMTDRPTEAQQYRQDEMVTRQHFLDEYVTTSGRMISDSQTAYALAICFDLLSPTQTARAGDRLAEIVRLNSFKIGTGFAGTPFVCEALARSGHGDVAYAMLLNEKCPSWLYPVTMGATTTWERWDSMLPDGSINPGEMTSFNHYAFGAVAKFLVERLAGLKCAEPGWKRARVEPVLEGPFTWAKAEHLTPYGNVSSSWTAKDSGDGVMEIKLDVVVPPNTEMDVVVPTLTGVEVKTVGSGVWEFTGQYQKQKEWPVKELSNMPI